MSDSLFGSVGNEPTEPVPGSTVLTSRAATECRRQGLADIEVTPLAFRAINQWLVRRTQQAIAAMAESSATTDSSKHLRKKELITRAYVHDVVAYCRDVKLGVIRFGLE
jgi:hypothetical protein